DGPRSDPARRARCEPRCGATDHPGRRPRRLGRSRKRRRRLRPAAHVAAMVIAELSPTRDVPGPRQQRPRQSQRRWLYPTLVIAALVLSPIVGLLWFAA